MRIKEAISIKRIIEMSKKNHMGWKSKLFREIRDFSFRNKIHIDYKDHSEFLVCARCLKAHILYLAKESKVHHERISYMIPGPIGHDGHYIDREKLIPLTSATYLPVSASQTS